MAIVNRRNQNMPQAAGSYRLGVNISRDMTRYCYHMWLRGLAPGQNTFRPDRRQLSRFIWQTSWGKAALLHWVTVWREAGCEPTRTCIPRPHASIRRPPYRRPLRHCHTPCTDSGFSTFLPLALPSPISWLPHWLVLIDCLNMAAQLLPLQFLTVITYSVLEETHKLQFLLRVFIHNNQAASLNSRVPLLMEVIQKHLGFMDRTQNKL